MEPWSEEKQQEMLSLRQSIRGEEEDVPGITVDGDKLSVMTELLPRLPKVEVDDKDYLVVRYRGKTYYVNTLKPSSDAPYWVFVECEIETRTSRRIKFV